MWISNSLLLLVLGLSCIYASSASDISANRLSDSLSEEENKQIDGEHKRASWLDFKRNGGQEYDGSTDDAEAKRASWLNFKRDNADKSASWSDFKRSSDLDDKRASWLDHKRASWLDFKRSHGDAESSGDKRATWLDIKKRASWLDFKRNSDKRASWLDFKRDGDKRASWLDFKRGSDSTGSPKRASWLDFKRALGSWIEAKEAQKRSKNGNTMDPETLKVIREMLLKEDHDITPSMRNEILRKNKD